MPVLGTVRLHLEMVPQKEWTNPGASIPPEKSFKCSEPQTAGAVVPAFEYANYKAPEKTQEEARSYEDNAGGLVGFVNRVCEYT